MIVLCKFRDLFFHPCLEGGHLLTPKHDEAKFAAYCLCFQGSEQCRCIHLLSSVIVDTSERLLTGVNLF